jgi:predicted nucleic acid-binding protein
MATTGVERIFIDTNVLTRATISTAPLHQQAKTELEQFNGDDQVELWISSQIIREYLANTTRPQTYMQPIPMEQVLEQIRRFRTAFMVAQETTQVLDNLLLLAANVPMGGKQLHDANVVATMLAYDIKKLFTNNVSDFSRYSNYIIVIPLVEKP